MRLREERRRPEVGSESLGDIAGDGSLDPFDMLDSIYCVIAVCDAIRRLPTDYQAVIQLRCIEDLDTREAAIAAGVTPNTVKMRLYRARHMLRELLRNEYRWRFEP
jgi:RNA polymerase sigma factor (sigma-70 family)